MEKRINVCPVEFQNILFIIVVVVYTFQAVIHTQKVTFYSFPQT
jgi:hypothetical protein